MYHHVSELIPSNNQDTGSVENINLGRKLGDLKLETRTIRLRYQIAELDPRKDPSNAKQTH